MSDASLPNFDSHDLYARLGVDKEASVKDIKQAFRALARDHHPDVAGDAPQAAERFKKIREAYETLGDPAKRHRYDNRGKGRPGLNAFRWEPGRPQENQEHRQSFSDDLDLDDIFSDQLKGGIFRGNAHSNESPDFGFGGRERPRPEPGADVSLRVEISRALAERGGSQMVEYARLRHKDGQDGLESYAEIFDLHLGAGTQHGDSVRIPRMGHAGANGGAYGDLICDLIVRSATVRPPPLKESPAAIPGQMGEVDMVIRITVQEALLGGRVEVRCPAGPVKVVIPPCTSSGTRMRLSKKGVVNPSGQIEDHEVQILIVTPPHLDAESRALIERFAALNPKDPKEPGDR
jgi:curved DNA-binding protein